MAGKIKWNSERILSLSAMSISFITLIIFIYQTNLMNKQNYLSILPYLQVSTSNNSEGNSYLLSIQNYGVGPAIIESVKMQYQGQEYDLRGFSWWGYAAGFSSYLAPNTAEPDVMQSSGYCAAHVEANPPCVAPHTCTPAAS